MTNKNGQDITLECTEVEKDLGVHIDNQLSFSKHIQLTSKKADNKMRLIRRSFRHMDKETFLLLYKSQVRQALEYGAVVWYPHTKKDMEVVEGVQRRATKLIPGFWDIE